jgi:photosystem II stability/assembly factor-like uncharacterized protein
MFETSQVSVGRQVNPTTATLTITQKNHIMKLEIYYLALACLAIHPLNADESKSSAPHPAPPSIADDYSWRSMPIGGGGFFIDVLPHPTRPDHIYVASDMCGPFFRTSPDESFVNAMYASPVMTDGSITPGVSDLAMHPDRPDTIFADVRDTGLMRSQDGGKTYEVVHPTASFSKHTSPSVTIDPQNPDVVYRGTSQDKKDKDKMTLYRSLQGGDLGTWEEIFTAPGANLKATYLVDIPVAGAMVEGRSQRVYVAVDGIGLFQSEDGGENFALVPENPVAAKTGSSDAKKIVRQNSKDQIIIAATPDGGCYVLSKEAVRYYHPDSGWEERSPDPDMGQFRGLSFNPKDPNQLIVLRKYSLYRSKDGGKHWEGPFLDSQRDESTVGSQLISTGKPEDAKRIANAGGSFTVFDPHQDNAIWLADAYMVWKCDDIWADNPEMVAQWRGLENTVAIDIAVAPRENEFGTELLAAFADMGGLRYEDPDELPTSFTHPIQGMEVNGKMMQGHDMCSVATSENHPDRWYGAINGGWEGPSNLIRSDDGGKTWKWSPNPLPEHSNHGGAKIAVSATDPDNLVYALGLKMPPVVSHDGGETWSATSGLPWLSKSRRNFAWNKYLGADSVDGKVFYAFNAHDAKFYISRDGGDTWQQTAAELPIARGWGGADRYPVQLSVKPGQAGALALSIGNLGIYLSDDYGESFRRLDPFYGDGMWCGVSYGAPVPGTDEATLYVQSFWYGAKERGIYRSTDDGESWVQINELSKVNIHAPMVTEASRTHFGRLYIANQGFGLVVGDPVE